MRHFAVATYAAFALALGALPASAQSEGDVGLAIAQVCGEVDERTEGVLAGTVLLTLGCWVGEALLNDDLSIPTLHETLASTTESVETWHTYVVRLAGRLVGSVRGRRDRDDTQVWEIGRLMVAPDLRGRGLGRVLLDHAEQVAPDDVRGFRLVTGKHSEANLRRYKRAGYRITEVRDDGPSGPVVLAKRRR